MSKNLETMLKVAYDAELNLAIWGTHGIGKTAGVRAFAKSIGAYLHTEILSAVDALVLGGQPGIEKLKDGTQLQIHACPKWIYELRQAAADGTPTILFLDEFNRADRFAHNAAMSLVLDHEIHGHKLPDNCFIVCAMNPETDGDMGVNELTDPMIDRFCHVAYHSDAAEWLTWAENNDVDSTVLGFIGQNKQQLNGFDLDFDAAVAARIKPTRRSWTAVSRVIKAITENGEINSTLLNKVGLSLLKGLIGETVTLQYVEYLKNNENQNFSLDQMLKPNKATLERVAKLVAENRTAVLNASLEIASREIPKLNLSDTEISNEKGFFKFLWACPVDIQSSFWTNESNAQFWRRILILLPADKLAALH